MPPPTTATTLPALPTEILDLIISYVTSERTLARLARVSHALNAIVVPHLYRHLVITRKDASKLFGGLPRRPVRRKQYQYKKEWDDAVEKFEAQFGYFLHAAIDPFEEVDEPPCEWTDSEPETDDEQPVPNKSNWRRKEEVEPREAGSEDAWRRKRQLFGYCRSLAVVQVPSKALCRDLLYALAPDKRNSWADKIASAVQPNVKSGTKNSPPVLFPQLTHISFGARAVFRLSEETNVGKPYGKRPHPFLKLVPMLGTPTAACVSCPPAEHPGTDAEYVFRRLRLPLKEMDELFVKCILYDTRNEGHGDKDRCERPQVVVSALPSSVSHLAVHNIRYCHQGLPVMTDPENRTYRYDYAPPNADGSGSRAAAITAQLQHTAPCDPDHTVIAEHVRIGTGVFDPDDVNNILGNADDDDDELGSNAGDDWDDHSDEWYDDDDRRTYAILDHDTAADQVIGVVDRILAADPEQYAMAARNRAVYLPRDGDPALDATATECRAAWQAALDVVRARTTVDAEECKPVHTSLEAARRRIRAAEEAVRKLRLARGKRFVVRDWVTIARSNPTKEERDAARTAYGAAKQSTTAEDLAAAEEIMIRETAAASPLEAEYRALLNRQSEAMLPLTNAVIDAEAAMREAKRAADDHKEQQRRLRLRNTMPPAHERVRYIASYDVCRVCGRMEGEEEGRSLAAAVREYIDAGRAKFN